MAIIAVLVAVAIPTFGSQLEKSRQSADLSNLRAAYAAAKLAELNQEDDTYASIFNSVVFSDNKTGAVYCDPDTGEFSTYQPQAAQRRAVTKKVIVPMEGAPNAIIYKDDTLADEQNKYIVVSFSKDEVSGVYTLESVTLNMTNSYTAGPVVKGALKLRADATNGYEVDYKETWDPTGLKFAVQKTDGSTETIEYNTSNSSKFTFVPALDELKKTTDYKVSVKFTDSVEDAAEETSKEYIVRVVVNPIQIAGTVSLTTTDGSTLTSASVSTATYVKSSDGTTAVTVTGFTPTYTDVSLTALGFSAVDSTSGAITGSLSSALTSGSSTTGNVKVVYKDSDGNTAYYGIIKVTISYT